MIEDGGGGGGEQSMMMIPPVMIPMDFRNSKSFSDLICFTDLTITRANRMAARKISVVPQEVSAALSLQRNQNQAPEEIQAEPEEMQVEGSEVSFFLYI